MFFGKFGVLCFLVTSVLRFALLSYYRRTKTLSFLKLIKTNAIYHTLTLYQSFIAHFSTLNSRNSMLGCHYKETNDIGFYKLFFKFW